MELLKCSRCGLLKLENEFSRNRHIVVYKGKREKNSRQALYGRTYYCLSCIREYRKELYKRNPSIAIRKNAKRRENRRNNLRVFEKERDGSLRYKYGITLETYEKMLKNQNGVCAICSGNNKHKTRKCLHVDHNHNTGKVQGLLCARCNTLLGIYKENISVLENAAAYLNKHL